MGNFGAQSRGMKEAPQKLDDVIHGMIGVFDAAKKESHGGKLWDFDGTELGFGAKD